MTKHISMKTLQVLLIGEHLRNRLHAEEDPVMIRDRRYHFRNFSCCFVGRELVDWLIKNSEANSRSGAVQFMNILLENSVVHHVCDDHHFKDEMLFYRFRRDDDTVVRNPDHAVIYKGCDIYHRVKNEDNLIKLRPCHDFMHRSCFTGLELVDWLIQNGDVSHRDQAVLLGRELLDQGIIKHDNQTSPESSDFFPSSGSLNQSPRPVIMREIRPEELLDPNGLFVSKNIKVKSDTVGFGFVVRGASPVHIQTVDPQGPAAAAGLKVGMYLKSVNGKNVLYWTHREVAQEMLRGQNITNLVVVTHRRVAH